MDESIMSLPIRATIAEEKAMLKAVLKAEADGTRVEGYREVKSDEIRKKFTENLDYLEYLADTLEAGKPVTRKPPEPPAAPKTFEDKVPEPGEVDLDGILD